MSRRVVYSHTSDLNRITVEDVDFLRTLRLGSQRQSSLYLDSPFDTDFDYPGYFHIALALNPAITRVLAIGLGGGMMVKRMWRDYPEMYLDAVELDPTVVEVARQFFGLPDDERITVAIGDGAAFLQSAAAIYDLIVVDAFDGEDVPPRLLTAEFCREARAHLSPDGVLAYNLHGSITGDASAPFCELRDTLSAVFGAHWVFPVEISQSGQTDELREIIVFATDAGVTAEELLGQIANRVDGRVSIPAFHEFGADLFLAGDSTTP